VQALAHQASHLATAEICSVFLLNEARTHLVMSATSRRRDPEAPPPTPTQVPLTWHDVGQILRSGQFTVMDHLDEDWEDASIIGGLLRDSQVYSGLVVPIAHRAADSRQPGNSGTFSSDGPQERDELLGALFVFTPGQRHHFWPTEIGLLQ